MKRLLVSLTVVSVLLWGIGMSLVHAEKGDPKEEAAIFKAAEGFVEAFHKGDAKTLAASWTADGEYTDQSGKKLSGRKAIEESFADFFDAQKGLKLRIDVDSLKFITPDVAIEEGTTAVITPDGGPPSRANYTIIHVKKADKWLISSVRETPFTPPSNKENLSGLDWLIGEWASAADKGEVATASFDWSTGENFVVANFTTTFKELPIGGGTQWIGYDPTTKGIRSWTFDTNGGFGEGQWTKDGNKWTIKSSAVLREGQKLTATNVITRVDAETISWESKSRTENGKALPDVPAIKLKRTK